MCYSVFVLSTGEYVTHCLTPCLCVLQLPFTSSLLIFCSYFFDPLYNPWIGPQVAKLTHAVLSYCLQSGDPACRAVPHLPLAHAFGLAQLQRPSLWLPSLCLPCLYCIHLSKPQSRLCPGLQLLLQSWCRG